MDSLMEKRITHGRGRRSNLVLQQEMGAEMPTQTQKEAGSDKATVKELEASMLEMETRRQKLLATLKEMNYFDRDPNRFQSRRAEILKMAEGKKETCPMLAKLEREMAEVSRQIEELSGEPFRINGFKCLDWFQWAAREMDEVGTPSRKRRSLAQPWLETQSARRVTPEPKRKPSMPHSARP